MNITPAADAIVRITTHFLFLSSFRIAGFATEKACRCAIRYAYYALSGLIDLMAGKHKL